jgi:CRISPR-associated protein Cas1
MTFRVIEIAENNRHLSLDRGFMSVQAQGAEIGRVPLDDMIAVIANAHGITHSTNLLLALGERGIPFVLCGPNHSPSAILWPVEGHHTQTGRMRTQIDASRPMEKRLWAIIVKSKIMMQAAVLDVLSSGGDALRFLARNVKSGDPDNIEAQAARRYWPLLMGDDFRRDRNAAGPNALLNYGYAILRSGTARAVMAAGLHPSIGIHHENRGNPMCLVDDLMEPFRPMVDEAVFHLIKSGEHEVTRDAKAILASVLIRDMETDAGTTPVATCLIRLATSLAHAFEGKRQDLDLPKPPSPLLRPRS